MTDNQPTLSERLTVRANERDDLRGRLIRAGNRADAIMCQHQADGLREAASMAREEEARQAEALARADEMAARILSALDGNDDSPWWSLLDGVREAADRYRATRPNLSPGSASGKSDTPKSAEGTDSSPVFMGETSEERAGGRESEAREDEDSAGAELSPSLMELCDLLGCDAINFDAAEDAIRALQAPASHRRVPAPPESEAREDKCVTMDCAGQAIGEARWYEDGLRFGRYCDNCLTVMERNYPDASITRVAPQPDESEAQRCRQRQWKVGAVSGLWRGPNSGTDVPLTGDAPPDYHAILIDLNDLRAPAQPPLPDESEDDLPTADDVRGILKDEVRMARVSPPSQQVTELVEAARLLVYEVNRCGLVGNGVAGRRSRLETALAHFPTSSDREEG